MPYKRRSLSTEQDNFARKEKYAALKMFCAQVVYLVLNLVPLYIYTGIPFIGFVHFFESVIREILSLLSSGFIWGLIRISVLALLAYPVVSIFSFCVFIWAYKTKNLQTRKVRIMCNLPLTFIWSFVIVILVILR